MERDTKVSAVDRNLDFFVVVKSHNHRQDWDGNRTLLNYHFFAEIFISTGCKILSAQIGRRGAGDGVRAFRPHGDDVLGDNAWYVEGGWYDDLEGVDQAFPNGEYIFDIETPDGWLRDGAVKLSGQDGVSEIPAAPEITLFQGGEPISPGRIDPELETIVTWGDYERGQTDPNGIIDDMVFVVAADCFGNRIVKSGLCFEDHFLDYREKSYRIPAGTLLPGRRHSMFVELPHVAHSVRVGQVPGFACFASATYMDLQTLGEPVGEPCPETLRPLDTGESDR